MNIITLLDMICSQKQFFALDGLHVLWIVKYNLETN
jgi:hypothetical protein